MLNKQMENDDFSCLLLCFLSTCVQMPLYQKNENVKTKKIFLQVYQGEITYQFGLSIHRNKLLWTKKDLDPEMDGKKEQPIVSLIRKIRIIIIQTTNPWISSDFSWEISTVEMEGIECFSLKILNLYLFYRVCDPESLAYLTLHVRKTEHSTQLGNTGQWGLWLW